MQRRDVIAKSIRLTHILISITKLFCGLVSPHPPPHHYPSNVIIYNLHITKWPLLFVRSKFLKQLVPFFYFPDALLADLQNTVSSEGNHVSSNATPGYGSLNGARTHNTNAYRSYESRTSPLPSQSVSLFIVSTSINLFLIINDLYYEFWKLFERSVMFFFFGLILTLYI